MLQCVEFALDPIQTFFQSACFHVGTIGWIAVSGFIVNGLTFLLDFEVIGSSPCRTG